MTAICYIGIELSARTQVGLLGAEFVILVVFAVVALAKVYSGSHIAHSVHPSLQWLNPFKIPSISALSVGMLTAVFLYWGWDTAVTVNEEAKDSKRTPGVAALLSTLVLLGIYAVVSVSAQAYHGAGFLTNNSNDILSALGHDVLGSPWDKLLIIAVLTSASASTQTTILPAGRSALSMAVHRAFPARFSSISPRFLSPGFATLLFGAVTVVWYVGLTILSPKVVLANSILATGFGITFYYGLTGFACVLYYRRVLFKSVKNFVFIGLAPFLGALILAAMFVISAFYYSDPVHSADGKTAWLRFIHFNFHVLGLHLYVRKGVTPILVIGVGLLLIGVPLMLLWWLRHPQFFRRHPEAALSLEAAAPPLTPGVHAVAD
jgi:amino acid transporter